MSWKSAKDSRLLHLPGGPTLVVLAALLVNANRRMSKTDLIRAAWGGDDVEEAQLYKRVKAVRDLLAEMGHGDHLKTHPRFGYEMRVAEDDVDALDVPAAGAGGGTRPGRSSAPRTRR